MKLHRFEDRVYASMDEDTPVSRIPTINHYCFEVIKETPQGYWIDRMFGKQWVSKVAKKRYAYPTVEEAWKSFKARKARQCSIYKAKLETATYALNASMPRICLD